MTRREYKGNAAKTRLTGNILAAATSFTIETNTNWPTGGANGPFWVTLDPDSATEERVLVGSQSGGNCTSVTRGQDGTTAQDHNIGAVGSVIHSSAGVDYDEANAHINTTTLDHHTQYMKADGTRHDLSARHTFTGLAWAPGTPAANVADQTGAAGSSEVPARSDHSHPTTCGIPSSVGTANTEGVSTELARRDHIHNLGAGSVNATSIFAAAVYGSPVALGVANANGAAATVARSDHVHGSVVTTQVFTAGGTWTKPANLRAARVRVVGGGGSGGGCGATGATQGSSASGGGGGGYAEGIFAAGSLGATETVTVGAGGAAAVAGANDGNAGGSSSFGALLSATGGGFGQGSGVTSNYGAGQPGGAGGTGTGGSFQAPGGNGGNGVVTSGAEPIPSGIGGNSLMSGIAQGQTNTIGTVGRNYGGGSSGACSGASQAARASTAGAGGIVIVEEFA